MSIYRFLFIFATEAIRLLITSRFVLSFLHKDDNRNKRLIAYAISLALTTCVYSFLNIAGMNLLATIIGLSLIGSSYIGSIKKRIFFVSYVLAISCIIDLAVYIFLSNTFDHNNYSDLGSILGLILLLVVQLFTSKMFDKNRNVEFEDKNWWQYVFSLVVCVLTCLVIITDNTISMFSLSIVCGSFLIVNLIIVYLFDDLIEKSKNEIDNQVLIDQMKAYEREIALQNEKVESVRSLRHDMKKHLAEIQTLFKEGANNLVNDYINRLNDELKESTPICDSGNPGLDTVLNYMLTRAVEKNVVVNCKLTVPREIKLSVYDMNIILGNLIENAIEANEGADASRIDLIIKYVKDSLIIEISNTYANEVKLRNGYPVTTKNLKEKHGYGIRNIQKILNQYPHTLDFEVSTDRFITRILMKI